jgi:hypothetical protein
MRLRVAASTVVLLGALTLCGCPHGTYFAAVNVGPPAPVVMGPGAIASPGVGWVWTDGYYDWAGNSWAWRSGRWRRPPHPGYVWRGPTYRRQGNGFRVNRGHWSRR